MRASKPLDIRIPLLAGLLAALSHCLGAPALAAIGDPSVTAGDSTVVDTPTASPETAPSNPDSTAVIPAAGATAAAVATVPLENTLPFTENQLPHSYPELSVELGLAAFMSGLTGVDEAFNKIEDVYAAAGYPLPATSTASPGSMLLATLTVWLNDWLDVACQLGRTLNEDSEVRLLGGIVSGRKTLPDSKNVSVHAGLGGGVSGFSFLRRYGAQVSPVDGSGGYYELESIELNGGGPYWTIQGGVSIRTGPHGALNGLIQYVGMGDVSTTTANAGPVTVNVSGAMIGASFALFY